MIKKMFKHIIPILSSVKRRALTNHVDRFFVGFTFTENKDQFFAPDFEMKETFHHTESSLTDLYARRH